MTSAAHRARARIRTLNRIRWIAKTGNVRRYAGPGPGPLWRHRRYIAWDPEVGDFSYDLDDLDGALEALARFLDEDPRRIREFGHEVSRDAVLHADYAQRRRAALLPRESRIGQRVLWWALVRARAPHLVVETGIWYGLGSLVLLRALELNEAEGRGGGRLVSFDPDPGAGWLVPARHARRWRRVEGSTEEALEPVLRSERVDVLIHDTPSTIGRERFELECALRAGTPELVLISGNGTNTTALPDLARERDLAFATIAYRARDHFFGDSAIGLAMPPRGRAVHRGTGTPTSVDDRPVC